MMEKIDETKRNADKTSDTTQIRSFLGPAISNAINLMITGVRYDYDHSIRKNLDAIFLGDQSIFHFFSLASCFPEIFKLLLLLPLPESKRAKFFFSYLGEYFGGIFKERQAIIDEMTDDEMLEESDNYIDVYLKHLKGIKNAGGATDDKEFFSGT